MAVPRIWSIALCESWHMRSVGRALVRSISRTARVIACRVWTYAKFNWIPNRLMVEQFRADTRSRWGAHTD